MSYLRGTESVYGPEHAALDAISFDSMPRSMPGRGGRDETTITEASRGEIHDVETSSVVRFKDLYAVLEITASASSEEINKAYKEKCRRWHPDKAPSEELRERYRQMYSLVRKAYRILSDDKLRHSYDSAARSDILELKKMDDRDTEVRVSLEYAKYDEGGNVVLDERGVPVMDMEKFNHDFNKSRSNKEEFDRHMPIPESEWDKKISVDLAALRAERLATASSYAPDRIVEEGERFDVEVFNAFFDFMKAKRAETEEIIPWEAMDGFATGARGSLVPIEDDGLAGAEWKHGMDVGPPTYDRVYGRMHQNPQKHEWDNFRASGGGSAARAPDLPSVASRLTELSAERAAVNDFIDKEGFLPIRSEVGSILQAIDEMYEIIPGLPSNPSSAAPSAPPIPPPPVPPRPSFSPFALTYADSADTPQ